MGQRKPYPDQDMSNDGGEEAPPRPCLEGEPEHQARHEQIYRGADSKNDGGPWAHFQGSAVPNVVHERHLARNADMINALAPPLQPIRHASFGEAYFEPMMRQRAMEALLQGRTNAPTATPGNGYGIQPTNGLASQITPTATPGNGYSVTPTNGLATAYTPGQVAAGQEGQLSYGSAVGQNAMAGPAGMPMELASFTPAYRPARPNDANPDVVLAVQRAATQVFGPGAEVIGTSGTGEHGSQRHRLSAAQRINPDAQHGYALDLQVKLPDGSLLRTDSPEAREFVRAAASFGISGLGAGSHDGDYMGAHGFHMDMYPIDRYTPSMGRAWASMGNQLEADFVAAYQPFGG